MKLPHSIVAASFAISAPAYAQEQAASPSPEASADRDAEDIVVLAPEDQLRIDRRVYTVRDDAEAQATDVFEILGRIPSVSVSPEGEVSLLGASGVQVQINGQPAPGQSLEQVLRGLPGAQVLRIEVITNQAAQFSASASGGIINIITKDRFTAGLAGSLRASLDTFGGEQIGAAPSWSGEKLTLSGWGGYYQGGEDRGEDGRRSYRPDGPNETKDGSNGFDYDGVYLGGYAVYTPVERRRYTLALGGGDGAYGFHETMRWTSDAAPPTLRARSSDNASDYVYASLERQQEGAEDPLSLTKLKLEFNDTASTALGGYSERAEGAASGSRYATRRTNDSTRAALKLDAERPRPDDRFLTYGGSVEFNEEEIGNALNLLEGSGPTPYAAKLSGEERTIAAYATYQFDLGAWRLQPGVRVEDYWRRVESEGLSDQNQDLRAFPSVHFRRALNADWKLDLSYSGRIQHRSFDQLDPVVRYFGESASSGNPQLKPTTIDAFETAVSYQKDARTVLLTFFDRISDDAVGTRVELLDGFIFSQPVNFGGNEERGVELQARGALGAAWSYTLSGNLRQRSYDALRAGERVARSVTEYGGGARFDYRDADQEEIGADQLQLNVTLTGPTYDLQSETEGYATLDVTWRRRLTERVVGVVSVTDVFGSRIRTSQIDTQRYFERTTRDSPGARLRLTLTYQFGDPSQRLQEPAAPPIPGG